MARTVGERCAPSDYELTQLEQISAWQQEEPGVAAKALGVAVTPLAWLVRQVVPEASMRAALESASATGRWLTDHKDILRDAHVEGIEQLRGIDLARCDELADSVHNWAIGAAVVEGTATGAGGVLAAPLDIPLIITLAMRTIHKIGCCYGFEARSQHDQRFVLGALSAACANSVAEKTAALTLLRTVEVTVARQTWRKIAEEAAKSALSREAGIIALRDLAKQLGVNLTKRRVLAAIPVVGAAVGGSVNGWFIREVGWSARRVFQERWMRHNGVADT